MAAMQEDLKRVSKFMSYVLRHRPDAIGLELDPAGWADIDGLIAKANADGQSLDRALIERVVAENDKQRFRISEDGLRIRASQGHSHGVDLALEPVAPPDILYHGTSETNLASIRASGLVRGRRQHVHLSPDIDTARKVAMRHGRPVVLEVAAGRMHAAGHAFYRSDNGVWLTDAVPPEYLTWPDRV